MRLHNQASDKIEKYPARGVFVCYHLLMILITGGAGYIGSHVAAELLKRGGDVVAFDNLSRSGEGRIKSLLSAFPGRISLVKGDIRSREDLDRLFSTHAVSSVVHCAALKSVPESVADPESYDSNNVEGTGNLLDAMARYGIGTLVFSSSAAAYGDRAGENIDEQTPMGTPASPYAATKQECERLIADWSGLSDRRKAVIFRYFNPIGANLAYGIGDKAANGEKNVFSAIADAVFDKNPMIIYGDDYPTRDGTCVRDYVHVMDIARAHADALEQIDLLPDAVTVLNLGRGEGVTVLELVRHFEKAAGLPIARAFAGRRPGDLAVAYANADAARRLLGWSARFTLDEAVESGWKWYLRNSP